MRNEYMELIVSKFGEPTQQYPAAEQTVEKYRAIFPKNIIDIWQSEGFCQFMQGLYYFTNPDDWQAVVDAWLKGTDFEKMGRFYAITRTGFGVLRVYHPETGTGIEIDIIKNIISGSIKNRITEREREISVGTYLILGDLERSDFFIGESEELIFKPALKKLGALGEYDMFAFNPAYSLLETMQMLPTLDNLIKVDAREHMLYLRSLIDVPTVWTFNTQQVLREMGYIK
ncbi:GAD-like domain-containing protein [Faucicola atlantae]|uniref:GAD-like domain-containing protein n=1 Tax=Faucicola atlantae TaxID=34059 RepID=UPI0025AFA4EB|nr:GAD-like domain-containing protein [Moraxella atlantae]